MVLKLGFAIFTLVTLQTKALAACPGWTTHTENFPACPTGGSTLLDERYPMVAAVVSDTGYKSGHTPKYAVSFVQKVLEAAPEGKEPMLLLPVTDDTFASVKAMITHAAISPTRKAAWLASIKQVPGGSFTWQQDYFESFTNPQGDVVLRSVEKYNKMATPATDYLADSSGCFVTGDPLTSETDPGGIYGGNIEALPGGLCAVGSDAFDKAKNEWSSYVSQFCGDVKKNAIQTPTSWLAVGHTDEIMKTIPNPDKPAPCNFSVGIASPSKALEVLAQSPTEIFMSPPGFTPKQALARQRSYSEGSSTLCSIYQNANDAPNTPPSLKMKKGHTVSQLLLKAIVKKAGAQILDDDDESQDEACPLYTNQQVIDLVKSDRTLRDYNAMIDQQMQKLEADVRAKLKERFPQCEPDIIKLPQLFFGGESITKGDGTKTITDGEGMALLPNLANSVVANKTLISPEPQNAAIKRYIEEQYHKRGLKTAYIDTFDYAHRGQGNLHCTTHEIRKCSPAKGAK